MYKRFLGLRNIPGSAPKRQSAWAVSRCIGEAAYQAQIREPVLRQPPQEDRCRSVLPYVSLQKIEYVCLSNLFICVQQLDKIVAVSLRIAAEAVLRVRYYRVYRDAAQIARAPQQMPEARHRRGEPEVVAVAAPVQQVDADGERYEAAFGLSRALVAQPDLEQLVRKTGIALPGAKVLQWLARLTAAAVFISFATVLAN